MRSSQLWLRNWGYDVVGAVTIMAGGLFAPVTAFGQTQRYIIAELPNQDVIQVPSKLNNFGDIAGRAGSESRAIIWNRSDLRPKHLDTLLGADYSSAVDINDMREVAGVSNTSRALVPFVWTPQAGSNRIPLLFGDSCGQANAINNHGDVVGYSSGPDGIKAVLWTRQRGVQKLPALPEASYSIACDINDAGEIVGTSGSSYGGRAAVWTKTGNVIDLGTLPDDWTSEAVAINNSGEVTGNSKGPRGTRGFVWNRATGMQPTGVLPSGNSSVAMDISDSGAVVGTSTTASGEHAFVWMKTTGIADLNTADSARLGVVFIDAHAINARGQIVAMGVKTQHSAMDGDRPSTKICAPGPPSSFLLTPASTP